MRKCIIFLMLSVLGVVSLSAQSHETPCVEVVGYAYVEVEPNEIWVSITIDERESGSKVTLQQLENKLLSVLNGMDIDTKEVLFVNGFSGTTHRRNNGVLYKNYSLRLSSAEQVGNVFDKLQSAGINRVSVVSTGRSDVAELKSKLRVEAMLNAQTRAQELAGAVGQNIGRAIYINDYNVDGTPVIFRAKTNGLSMGAELVTESYEVPEFSNIKLDYRVTVKFSLLAPGQLRGSDFEPTVIP